MKVRTIGVAMVVCVLAAGCSGGDGTAKVEDLPDRLLTLDDMPSGWSVTDELGDDDDNSTFCPEAETVVSGVEEVDSVEVAFAQGQLGPFVAEMIAPATKDQYSEMVTAMDSCVGRDWTSTDDEGAETKYSMEELSASTLGDESQAYRLTGEVEGGLINADIIVGTGDGAVVLLMGIAITSFLGASEISADDFDDVVKAASEKLTS
jgi:hypothetical protein